MLFEAAELGHKLPKGEFRKIEPKLRTDLLDAQYDLSRNGRFPVIVLISGVRGAGKGETVNLLNEWMDPRHIHTHAFDNPSDEERERPPMWRYWRALPPRGSIGVLFGSWYTAPIVERVFRRSRGKALLRSIEEINRFERMLADDGALILKFWFHLSKNAQKKRLKSLADNPATAWKVSARDWDFFRRYDRFCKVSEGVLGETDTGHAPWIVVEGVDPEYRAVTVGRALLSAMRRRLDGAGRAAATAAPPRHKPADGGRVLDRIDLSKAMPEARYERQLAKYQGMISRLTLHPRFREHSVVLAFEGMDAAGKGGAIRRIASALDARLYHIVPVAAPTDEERAQPYLWRFWRHLPRKGRFVIYDRSWYGRVLVERVEGFCAEADWMRAYAEINDFEEAIARAGGIVLKFWLQISKQEQYRRFKEREKTRFKRFKITPEDWRNRRRWTAYQEAASDMIGRTSTGHAPWTLVEANDKYWARIKVLRTLAGTLERHLD